jgi:hypothetical protein
MGFGGYFFTVDLAFDFFLIVTGAGLMLSALSLTTTSQYLQDVASFAISFPQLLQNMGTPNDRNFKRNIRSIYGRRTPVNAVAIKVKIHERKLVAGDFRLERISP